MCIAHCGSQNGTIPSWWNYVNLRVKMLSQGPLTRLIGAQRTVGSPPPGSAYQTQLLTFDGLHQTLQQRNEGQQGA